MDVIARRQQVKGNITRGPWKSEHREANDGVELPEREVLRQQTIDECIATVLATLPARDGHTCCQGLRHAILHALTTLRDEDRANASKHPS